MCGRANKAVRCVTHDPTTGGHRRRSSRPARPGSSARREFERRRVKREERIRAKHLRLGGFILAVTDEQQSTKAWDTGTRGEERLGARLNELAPDTLRVLHDRRIPGTHANIDHSPWPHRPLRHRRWKVQGRPQLRDEGGLFRASRGSWWEAVTAPNSPTAFESRSAWSRTCSMTTSRFRLSCASSNRLVADPWVLHDSRSPGAQVQEAVPDPSSSWVARARVAG
jgi:hypothetical protein